MDTIPIQKSSHCADFCRFPNTISSNPARELNRLRLDRRKERRSGAGAPFSFSVVDDTLSSCYFQVNIAICVRCQDFYPQSIKVLEDGECTILKVGRQP